MSFDASEGFIDAVDSLYWGVNSRDRDRLVFETRAVVGRLNFTCTMHLIHYVVSGKHGHDDSLHAVQRVFVYVCRAYLSVHR